MQTLKSFKPKVEKKADRKPLKLRGLDMPGQKERNRLHKAFGGADIDWFKPFAQVMTPEPNMEHRFSQEGKRYYARGM